MEQLMFVEWQHISQTVNHVKYFVYSLHLGVAFSAAGRIACHGRGRSLLLHALFFSSLVGSCCAALEIAAVARCGPVSLRYFPY